MSMVGAMAPAATASTASTFSTDRDLDLLTGVDAGGMLGAAVAAAEGTLQRWRARDVTHHPGRGSTVSYDVKVRWANGRSTTETMAACTGALPEGALHLDDGTVRVAVWRYPYDPDLPGLAAANDPRAVAQVLDEFGFGLGPVRLRTRAYRPGRRAVIEAIGARGRLFLKVVQPSRVQALHRRHRLLVDAGVPAPQSFGWTADGLLVLQALPGRTLREAMRSRSNATPSAEAILDLLDRLPAGMVDGAHHRSWLDRVGHYANVVGAVVPEEAERLHQLAAAIAAEAGTGPTVPVHGDFYESQILVGGGRVSGLLDIDAARAGDRLDDLGCLIGHLSVLAQLDPARARAINRLGARYLDGFERTVDVADLRYRAAAVVISLATGPHRVQDRNWPALTRRLVDLAERWLISARATRSA